jgi:hypothetical protein
MVLRVPVAGPGKPDPEGNFASHPVRGNAILHEIIDMEKRILGIILSILGVVGLVLAAVSFINMNGGSGKKIKEALVYGLLGAIFFFAGISLIRNTKDKET